MKVLKPHLFKIIEIQVFLHQVQVR